jgi:hypothetical protein
VIEQSTESTTGEAQESILTMERASGPPSVVAVTIAEGRTRLEASHLHSRQVWPGPERGVSLPPAVLCSSRR